MSRVQRRGGSTQCVPHPRRQFDRGEQPHPSMVTTPAPHVQKLCSPSDSGPILGSLEEVDVATKPTLINSVVRALRLLDIVGAADAPVPAKKLAHQGELPLATTYHLLRTLVHEGYLTRTPDGYVIGDRVDSLVTSATPRHSRQVLQQLHDELDAAAYLSVLDAGEIRLVEIVDSPAAPRIDLWVGFHDAAHATALGKAVLATFPEQHRQDYLSSHPLVDLTPHTVTSRRSLLQQLAATDSAVTTDQQEYALGTVCVACAVPEQNAAVAVSVPAHRGAGVMARTDALRRAAHLLSLARHVDTPA